MKIISTFLVAIFLIVATASAQDRDTRKTEDRLHDAGVVMSEVLSMPDTIPHYLLDRTKCVVVIPSVRKAAFVVGAS
jgi:SH3 domain-containing YSC84-like protein 1